MQKCIEHFIFHCEYEKNLSEKTLKAYKIDIDQFCGFLKQCHNSEPIQECDKTILKDFVRHLFEKDYKAKTVIRKLATLKALYSYLEFEEFILVNPFRKMRLKIKEPARLPKIIKITEIKKILKKMYSMKTETNEMSTYSYNTLIRDISIVEILFSTGMRVAEISDIKREDVDLKNSTIRIVGKGDKERTVHICSEQIRVVLKEYSLAFKSLIEASEYFFINRNGNKISEQSIRFMIKKYTKLANVNTHITPHMFRHSMATYLLEEGVDIRYIQNILGHSSISTTQLYTKVNLKHQKKILNTRHPRRKFDLEI